MTFAAETMTNQELVMFLVIASAFGALVATIIAVATRPGSEGRLREELARVHLDLWRARSRSRRARYRHERAKAIVDALPKCEATGTGSGCDNPATLCAVDHRPRGALMVCDEHAGRVAGDGTYCTLPYAKALRSFLGLRSEDEGVDHDAELDLTLDGLVVRSPHG